MADHDLATIDNPSSALTDFTLIVDLSNMSASWWSANDTAVGAKGRVFKADGTTELASDWIDFDNGGETGFLRVKWSGTLASSGTQELWIEPPLAANSTYGAADTYGSDNAYDASWEGYYPVFGDSSTTLTDRTVNGEDGTLQTGVTFSGDKLVHAASNEGVHLMDSDPLSGAAAFTIFIEANFTNVDADRPLFYTGAHSGTGPIVFWGDAAATDWIAGLITASGGTTNTQNSNHVISAATDYHYVLKWAGADNMRLYVAGVEDTGSGFPDASATGTLAAAPSGTYQIGADQGHTRQMVGTIWNVQVHSAARHDDWISEEYSQTNDNANFYTTWTWVPAAGGSPVASILQQHAA